jgi:hypothetical protein
LYSPFTLERDKNIYKRTANYIEVMLKIFEKNILIEALKIRLLPECNVVSIAKYNVHVN